MTSTECRRLNGGSKEAVFCSASLEPLFSFLRSVDVTKSDKYLMHLNFCFRLYNSYLSFFTDNNWVQIAKGVSIFQKMNFEIWYYSYCLHAKRNASRSCRLVRIWFSLGPNILSLVWFILLSICRLRYHTNQLHMEIAYERFRKSFLNFNNENPYYE